MTLEISHIDGRKITVYNVTDFRCLRIDTTIYISDRPDMSIPTKDIKSIRFVGHKK